MNNLLLLQPYIRIIKVFLIKFVLELFQKGLVDIVRLRWHISLFGYIHQGIIYFWFSFTIFEWKFNKFIYLSFNWRLMCATFLTICLWNAFLWPNVKLDNIFVWIFYFAILAAIELNQTSVTFIGFFFMENLRCFTFEQSNYLLIIFHKLNFMRLFRFWC